MFVGIRTPWLEAPRVQECITNGRYMYMRRMTLRFMLVYATLVVLFAAVTVPALGAEDLSSFETKISQTVNQAEAGMQQVLNRFTMDAINATSQNELKSLQTAAHSDINAIYEAAIAELNIYLAAYPDELDAQVDQAKARLVQSDAAAHDEINTTAAQISPTLPPSTTTTTVPPSTTTTTATVTTTTTSTTEPTISSTTTVPRTTTTTIPPTTTTTTTDSATTTTAVAVAPLPPPPGADEEPAAGSNDTMPPSAVFDTTSERAYSFSEAMRSDSRMMTGTLVEGMSVVLPPAVATAVLSLPIVIEIVVGTLFDSAQSLFVPVLILIGAALIIIWRESKSRASMPRPTT